MRKEILGAVIRRQGFVSHGFCCNHQTRYNTPIQALSSSLFPPSVLREHINLVLVAHAASSQGGRHCGNLMVGSVRRLAEKSLIYTLEKTLQSAR